MSEMRAIIHQPHFLPGTQFLARIQAADKFVFLDNVQYVKREWQNRNYLPDGLVSLPVGKDGLLINEKRVVEGKPFLDKLAKRFLYLYRGKPGNDLLQELVKEMSAALESDDSFTCLLRRQFEWFCQLLGLERRIRKTYWARYLNQVGCEDVPEPCERLARLVEFLQCTKYAHGQGGMSYMTYEAFDERCISVDLIKWTPHPEIDPKLSVVDVIGRFGDQARYMLGEVSFEKIERVQNV